MFKQPNASELERRVQEPGKQSDELADQTAELTDCRTIDQSAHLTAGIVNVYIR
jgi:hypothetical protein